MKKLTDKELKEAGYTFTGIILTSWDGETKIYENENGFRYSAKTK